MSGIGRAVAAILLAGAVAGAAAFAHLLASEPAPGPFGHAALPPAPTSPLIVQAAPWSPERPAARVHVVRPAVHGMPPTTAPEAARPIFVSRIHAPSTVPSAPLPTKRAQAAPGPPAPAPAAPQPATQPAASQPAAPPPAPAPAPTPTPAPRALATAAPVTAAVTAAAGPVASGEGRRQPDHERWCGHDVHDKRAGGRNEGSGNARRGSNGPTVPGAPVSGASVLSVPVSSAVPPATPTPQPVVTPPLPSVDPPSVGVTPTDAGGHDHGRNDGGYGYGNGYGSGKDDGSGSGYGNWRGDGAGH